MQVKSRAFLLIAAVVLAGCVGQTTRTGGGTAGVIITSFAPEIPEVESGADASFFTIVKNVGDTPTTIASEIILLGLDDWTGNKISEIGSLQPADPGRGLEGEEELAEFKLTAPKLKGVSLTYTPTARVMYNYQTKSTIQFSFATTELIRGEPQQSTVQVTTTGGPFSIVLRGSLPVISSTNPTAKVQLEIQNVGGGVAGVSKNANDIDSINFDITRKKPDGTGFSCNPAIGNIRLIGGKSRILTCTITLSPSSISRADFATAVVDINLNYYYIVDTQTSVKVKGTT